MSEVALQKLDELVKKCRKSIRRYHFAAPCFSDDWSSLPQGKPLFSCILSLKLRYASQRRMVSQFRNPDHCEVFRVQWIDSSGVERLSNGYAVLFSNYKGPYSGRITVYRKFRSHELVRFAALQSTILNLASGLPLGGAHVSINQDLKRLSDKDMALFQDALEHTLSQIFENHGSSMNMFTLPKHLQKDPLSKISRIRGTTEMLTKVIPECSFQGTRFAICGFNEESMAMALRLREMGGVIVAISDNHGTIVENTGFNLDQMSAMQTMMVARDTDDLKQGQQLCYSLESLMSISGTSKWYFDQRPWSHVCFDVAISFKSKVTQEQMIEISNSGAFGFIQASLNGANRSALDYSSHKMRFTVLDTMNVGPSALIAFRSMRKCSQPKVTPDEAKVSITDEKADFEQFLREVSTNMWSAVIKQSSKNKGRSASMNLMYSLTRQAFEPIVLAYIQQDQDDVKGPEDCQP